MNETIRKYRSLVERLYHRTKAEKLAWKWDQEDSLVTIKIGNSSIDLKKGTNNNYEDLITVTVYGPAGHVVDEFDDEYISEPGLRPLSVNFDSFYFLMDALYEMAYRQAIGADKALDQILSELDDDEDPF